MLKSECIIAIKEETECEEFCGDTSYLIGCDMLRIRTKR